MIKKLLGWTGLFFDAEDKKLLDYLLKKNKEMEHEIIMLENRLVALCDEKEKLRAWKDEQEHRVFMSALQASGGSGNSAVHAVDCYRETFKL